MHLISAAEIVVEVKLSNPRSASSQITLIWFGPCYKRNNVRIRLVRQKIRLREISRRRPLEKVLTENKALKKDRCKEFLLFIGEGNSKCTGLVAFYAICCEMLSISV